MAPLPPPLPAVPESRFEMVSISLGPDALAEDCGAWVVASGALLEAVRAAGPANVEDAPETAAPASAGVGNVEAELTTQLVQGAAQLHVALGRLAAIRALAEGIEAAFAALAAGDAPVHRSKELRDAIGRVRALADTP